MAKRGRALCFGASCKSYRQCKANRLHSFDFIFYFLFDTRLTCLCLVFQYLLLLCKVAHLLRCSMCRQCLKLEIILYTSTECPGCCYGLQLLWSTTFLLGFKMPSSRIFNLDIAFIIFYRRNNFFPTAPAHEVTW